MTVKKVLTTILCLAWIFSVSATSSTEGYIDLRQKESTPVPKSQTEMPLSAEINGNTLTLSFLEDLGSITVSITTASGMYVGGGLLTITPNDAQYYIRDAGYYVVTIMLSNGESYYGEFSVN